MKFLPLAIVLCSALASEPQGNASCEEGSCAATSKLLLQKSLQQRDTRSLLSKRDSTSRDVPCWSTITDAVKCGVDSITSASVCGTSTITSAAKCGESTFKACDQRRRRRHWNKIKCKWSSVAKSCEEPKSCDVAKSCDDVSGWSSCLEDVVKSVSGTYRDFTKFITDSGCSSLDGCEKAITDGLDGAWEEIADTIQSGVSDAVQDQVLDNLAIDPINIISSAKSGVEDAFSDVDLSGVTDILNSVFGTFSPYDIDPCPPSGVGFWYMQPTDCGTFGYLSSILDSVNNAQTNFDKCVDSLEECVKMTGALGFPTPFLEFKIHDSCLPDYVETPLEYILGAFEYAYNSGAALVSEITGLFDKLKSFVENNLGMSMLQLGRDVKGQKLALLQDNSTVTKAGTWSLGTGICFDFPFPLLTASACVHLIWGERDGSFVEPNLVFELGMTRGIWGATSFDAGEPEPGFSLALSFQDDYPGFLPASEPRMGMGAGIGISLDAEIQGIAEAGVGFTVSFLPDPTAATGFGLSLSVARDAATDLVQNTMLVHAKEAERQMHARGQSHLASSAGLLTALNHLGKNVDTVLTKTQLHKAPELLKKVAEKPLHEYVPKPKAAMQQDSAASSVPVKINGKIESSMSASLCLTFPNCNGQA